MQTQMTPDWQTWIHNNLARGCTPESILADMKAAGFPHMQALQAIQQAHIQVSSVPQMDQGYVYEPSRIPKALRIDCGDRTVNVRFRSSKPSVVLVDELFSSDECDELIRLARLKLKRSAIVDPVTGLERVIEARSSLGTYFDVCEDEFIARLDRRVAALMHWPMENGEGFQILNYQVGAEYQAHFDYFPAQDWGSQSHLAKGGQRVSTLVMYLNDVDEGGETTFPSAGISVAPKKGAALYFEYGNSLGQVDPLSLHAGMPVLRGEKWIATKWMRQHPYRSFTQEVDL